jgi:hypothetical protein
MRFIGAGASAACSWQGKEAVETLRATAPWPRMKAGERGRT